MEAIGAAASVIGVVSLALQLVETVQRLNSFLTSLEDAPEQVQRLIDNLANLNGVLQDVKNIAEMQQFQSDSPPPCSTMVVALKGCQKEVKSLEAVLKKAQVGYESRRRIARKWNSLKIAVKMKDIIDFEDKIRDSMQCLMLSTMANLSIISISSHSGLKILLARSVTATQLNSTPIAFVSETPAPDQKTDLSPRLMSRTVGQPFRYRSQHRRLELTSSTQELISIDPSNQSQKNIGLGRKKIISISVWFLQCFYRLQIETGSGSWKQSFTVYQKISDNDEIWGFSCDGDIPSLQKLFTNGTYSPFIKDEQGWTLIHYAACCDQAETIMFLLQLGVDANITDDHGFLPLRIMPFEDLKTCKVLIKHGQNDPMTALANKWGLMQPEAMFWVLNQQEFFFSSQEYEDILHKFAQAFSHRVLMSSFVTESPYWSKTLFHLPQDGLNMPSSLNSYGQTPLDCLFSHFESNEFSSQISVARWLELLTSVQVDEKEYIADEKRLHPDHRVVHDNSEAMGLWQRRYIFGESSNEKQNVSWEWFISPESPAHILLREFKILCKDHDFWYNVREREHWPFDSKIGYWYTPYPRLVKVHQRRYDRQAQRRERRRTHYKIPREYQARRSGRYRMPGSWTEAKYELFGQHSNFSLSIPRWLIFCIIGLAGNLLLHVYLTGRICYVQIV